MIEALLPAGVAWSERFDDDLPGVPPQAAPDPVGPHAVGPHAVGPHAVGPHAVGPHAVGPHAVGPHAVGPHAVGPHAAGLYPVEEAAVSRAVAKRRREFATGRWCARQALAGLGLPPVAIPVGERGAPGWPPGVVGAITHCAGYRAAIVAHATAYQSVGLDAEPDGPLPDGVLDGIALSCERDQLGRLPAGPSWERLLFSAKESVYKAWYPLTRRWLEFTDCELTLAPDGTFTARLLVDGPLKGFDGRWLEAHGLVATVIALPAD